MVLAKPVKPITPIREINVDRKPVAAATAVDPVVVLRKRLADAVSAGRKVSALVLFNNIKTNARISGVEDTRVHVRIIRFNNLETSLPWKNLAPISLAHAVEPHILPQDGEGLLALMAVHEHHCGRLGRLLTGAGDAEDVDVLLQLAAYGEVRYS